MSIIIIFLDAERFIQEAIESVLSQTYQRWELLLVDDGSTDSSTQIAQRYADNCPKKIIYLEHDGHRNKGKSSSRNLGIRHARGEYIAFLDADDVFLPLKLEQQMSALSAHPDAVMVYSNTLYWHSWQAPKDSTQQDYLLDLGVRPNTAIQPPMLMDVCFGSKGAMPCICSFLIRRTVVEKVGGFEESIQHLYEDQVFLAKVFSNFTVFVADGYWEKYRQHPASSWHVSMRTGEDKEARLTFLNWLEQYLVNRGLEDLVVRLALRKHIWRDKHPVLIDIVDSTRWLFGRLKKQLLPSSYEK